MQVRLLGPVQLRDRDGPVPIGPRVRVVLAALALSPGRAVSVDRLVAAVWPEHPPATATAQIQACVSALRRALSRTGLPARDVIVTIPPGYMLSAGPDQVDVLRFDRELARARDAADSGDADQAAGLLRDALAQWHGHALEGFPGLAAEATRLEQRRVGAVEQRVDADLACGRHFELIPELTSLVAEYPLRERFSGQLMRALHRSGRRSEALEVYQETRRALIEDLGLEPGPELQRVQREILVAADPDPGPAPRDRLRSSPPGEPSPLPAGVADFTGRRRQVAEVIEAITGAEWPCSAMATVAITGPGGAGKTTLAVHVAHRLRARFVHGRLYADLHGSGAAPAEPVEVLGRLLRRLGVESRSLPDREEERAELFRARLDGRRVLVVLDDAADEAQVRPLLPGSATCAAITTSRRRLTGLPGAARVEVGPFTSAHAVELLGRVIGGARVAAEPPAAERIADLCDRLPLALRIAGARLAARPHWTLDLLARRLADERRRLDELVHADLEVRGGIGRDYERLSPVARRAFRLLGLLDDGRLSAGSAAALLDVVVTEAENLVEELLDARLLEIVGPDASGRTRYRFPGLVRAYARERALAEERPADWRVALERALATRLRPADEASFRRRGGRPAPAGLDLDPGCERADVVPLAGADAGTSGGPAVRSLAMLRPAARPRPAIWGGVTEDKA